MTFERAGSETEPHPQAGSAELAMLDLERVRHLGDERKAEPAAGAVGARDHADPVVGDGDLDALAVAAGDQLDRPWRLVAAVGVEHRVGDRLETASLIAATAAGPAPAAAANSTAAARAAATVVGSAGHLQVSRRSAVSPASAVFSVDITSASTAAPRGVAARAPAGCRATWRRLAHGRRVVERLIHEEYAS